MRLKPSPGYTFIQEDKRDSLAGKESLKESGFSVDDKLAGETGIVLVQSGAQEGKIRRLWNLLFAENVKPSFKEGQRVIYSKFVSEHLDDVQIGGEKIEGLRSVPTEAILAVIHD